MEEPTRKDVLRLTVSNESSCRTNLVLEPLGEVYPLEPGDAKTITYASPPSSAVAVDVGDGELKLWAEGEGRFEVD